MNDLTAEEVAVFEDKAIEAAYAAWYAHSVKKAGPISPRKQFLMRIRALLQAGKIVR